jgi:dynein light chain Tctex-type 1
MLIKKAKPYKYMINCMIMQRTGVGAFSAASCYWDGVVDGVAMIKWPKDKEAKQELAKN